MRGGAVVARWAHNPEVAGSTPAPASLARSQNQARLVSKAAGRALASFPSGKHRAASAARCFLFFRPLPTLRRAAVLPRRGARRGSFVR